MGVDELRRDQSIGTAERRRERRRLTALVLASVVVVLFTGCQWQMCRDGLAHTGFNPTEATIDVGNVASLTAKYAVTTGDPIGYSSPAVAYGTVYVGSQDGKLYAVNEETGGVVWTASVVPVSSPAVANGFVYIGTGGSVTA